MKRPPYGVLLVTGRMTHQENYSREFALDTRCRLIALTDEADVDPERDRLNRELAAELGIPHIANLDEALARPDVDLVSVCSEPERRGRILARCAAAGKHIYIDKPMTPFPEVADQVVRAAKKTGVKSQMFSTITWPWSRKAKRIVQSGVLGDLVAVHADCLFAKGQTGTANLAKRSRRHFPATRFTFVDAKAELYEIGVYAVGLARWLFEREVQTVYGITRNFFFASHQNREIEDFGFLALQFEGGGTATATGGRVGWTSHPAGGINQIHLIGTKASLLVDANSPRLELSTSGPPWTPPAVNPLDPMGFWSSTQKAVDTRPKESWRPIPMDEESKPDESCFIDCLEQDRESEMDVRDAAAITEILIGGYQSADSGKVVSLPLPRRP